MILKHSAKPTPKPAPLTHLPVRSSDVPTNNHRWSEIIPPDTALTFAVIWDPEDGLVVFSGAELLGSANYFPDSRPMSPSEPLDAQSQVITLKTLSSTHVLSETPRTLAFFRDTHRYLFAGSHSRLSLSKRARHGVRTQTSSTVGGADVYIRGSLLGTAHDGYPCLDHIEQDFEVGPFNTPSVTDIEMRYNRAFSVFAAEHHLSSRFSITTTSTSSYISVSRDEGDDDFASKTWSMLERPKTPIFSRPMLPQRRSPNTICSDLCSRTSQRLRKCRRTPDDILDIPTPPSEVLQRSEYNHEVKIPTRDCHPKVTTLLRGLSNRWKKGRACTY
ncbi:hypothetical protein BDN71DRAFT_558053 [Pleurotus eryngii]|uniref:Uncharacterized protein n=1 Tax=Pleurotus eryngii TaxID=5323 RepID=A0A9P6A0L9_PLEER|nr:hypothetical protein BDN71DRAFT_558053 [Pleurotus eryngii]